MSAFAGRSGSSRANARTCVPPHGKRRQQTRASASARQPFAIAALLGTEWWTVFSTGPLPPEAAPERSYWWLKKMPDTEQVKGTLTGKKRANLTKSTDFSKDRFHMLSKRKNLPMPIPAETLLQALSQTYPGSFAEQPPLVQRILALLDEVIRLNRALGEGRMTPHDIVHLKVSPPPGS